MAHGQPNPLAQFTKGQSPYKVANLCATLNWLISCLKELKADAGVNITGLLDGRLHIGLKLEAGDNISITSTPGGSKKITCTLDPPDPIIAVRVNDTDYTDVTKITLSSASDSAVTFSASQSDGNVSISIGVHYVD